MKRKREDDATNEKVMALLTTCTSCSCQESSSEHCYIHGQPVMFEGDPKLLEESKEKKREYSKKRRQDLRQKELLLLKKSTEDLTPEELEEVRKIKEKKEKQNLDQKNRYHSRREKAKENSLQNTEEVGAKIAADDQLMDTDSSKNVDPLEIHQQAKDRQRSLCQKKQILLETSTEDLTPEELEKVQKMKEKKDRRNLNSRNWYQSLTSEQKKEVNSKKNASRRQKELKKSLQKTEEVEAKIGRDDQLLDDSFNKNIVESKEVTNDPEILTVLDTLDASEAAEVSNADSTSPDTYEHDSRENMDISESQTFADSATEKSSTNMTQGTSDPEVLTLLDTLEASNAAEASNADSTSHNADEHDTYENMDIFDSQTSADTATQESSTDMSQSCQLRELTEASVVAEVSNADSTSQDADKHDSYENMDISECQTFADLATLEPITDMTQVTSDPEVLTVLDTLEASEAAEVSNADSTSHDLHEHEGTEYTQLMGTDSSSNAKSLLFLERKVQLHPQAQNPLQNLREKEPTLLEKSTEGLTPEEVDIFPDSTSHDVYEHDSYENMDISESKTLANLATCESSTDMTPEESCQPRELTEMQDLRKSMVAKRKYRELPEDKKRELIMEGTKYTQRRRQKIEEKRAKNAQLMDTDSSNNAEFFFELAQYQQQNLLEKNRILLEKTPEDLAPEELEMVQKIIKTKGRNILYWKMRYDSLTVEQKEERKSKKNVLKRQKASKKSLQKTGEVGAKIGQNDQLLDDSFNVESRDLATLGSSTIMTPKGNLINFEVLTQGTENTQLMGTESSNTAEPLLFSERKVQRHQHIQFRRRNLREKERILLEQSTENSSPEELAIIQKIIKKKGRNILYWKMRYQFSTLENAPGYHPYLGTGRSGESWS